MSDREDRRQRILNEARAALIRSGDLLADADERRARNRADPDFDVPPRRRAPAEIRRGQPVTTPQPVVRQPPTVSSTQAIDARIRLALRAVGEMMAEAQQKHDEELDTLRRLNTLLLARVGQLEADAAGQVTTDAKVLDLRAALARGRRAG
jgi:cell division septum initiation protein DivIVA